MRGRVLEAIRQAASEFINRESNRTSMITVTRVEMDYRGLAVEIYISVYPDKDLHAATDFLNRKRDAFKEYLKKAMKIRAIPRITFLAEPNIGKPVEEPKEA